MTPERLNEIKQQVQAILDHHLPEEKRFSVKDLDEEGVFLLVKLLLAKDKKEKQKLWDYIKKQKEESMIRMQEAKHKMLETIKEINEGIWKYKELFKSINEMNDLMESIKIDRDFESVMNH